MASAAVQTPIWTARPSLPGSRGSPEPHQTPRCFCGRGKSLRSLSPSEDLVPPWPQARGSAQDPPSGSSWCGGGEQPEPTLPENLRLWVSLAWCGREGPGWEQGGCLPTATSPCKAQSLHPGVCPGDAKGRRCLQTTGLHCAELDQTLESWREPRSDAAQAGSSSHGGRNLPDIKCKIFIVMFFTSEEKSCVWDCFLLQENR